jgi:hypothetical protein
VAACARSAQQPARRARCVRRPRPRPARAVEAVRRRCATCHAARTGWYGQDAPDDSLRVRVARRVVRWRLFLRSLRSAVTRWNLFRRRTCTRRPSRRG